jgi:hypothetical protein
MYPFVPLADAPHYSAGPTVEIVFSYRNQRTLANHQDAASVVPVSVLPRLAFNAARRQMTDFGISATVLAWGDI